MITGILPEKRLNGAYYEEKWPHFTGKGWIENTYQPRFHNYLQQNYGFRTFFIRLYNQIRFSLFNQVTGSGVILGKNNYLYEEWFIDSHYGIDYAGDQTIATYTSRLVNLREALNRMNTELIVVLTPSKADFWPEYIPDRYRKTASKTNYQAFHESFTSAGIPLIDFNQYFIDVKQTAHFPLFPKTGTHWSHYGARVALDTLVGFIAATLKRPMPDIELLATVPSDTLMNPDDDLEQLCNLIFPMWHLEAGYPEMVFKGAENMDLPAAIVIADSYFWPMFNLHLNERVFSDLKYWYYNSTIYPDNNISPLTTKQIDLKTEIDKADLVILMACPATINSFGWGFIERGFRELVLGMTPEQWEREYQKMIGEYRQAIFNTPEWIEHIRGKADKMKLPFDTVLQRDAKYMVDQMILRGEF
jgi:hypothetical protein